MKRLVIPGAVGSRPLLVSVCSLSFAVSQAFAAAPEEGPRQAAIPVSSGAATVAESQTWTFKSEINGVEYQLFCVCAS